MSGEIVILGMGGHARVVADACLRLGWKIAGFVAPQRDESTQALFPSPFLGGDEVLVKFAGMPFVNGLGSLAPASRRTSLYGDARSHGCRFLTLIHPSATVAATARLGEGAQVHAGAVTQAGCVIGENVIFNTQSSVDHDCVIGDHCHIGPGAVLCGHVHLGRDVHVGAGVVIIQGVEIGDTAFIAAGAVVTKHVAPGARMAGVPARAI